jgi:hypothetical protein
VSDTEKEKTISFKLKPYAPHIGLAAGIILLCIGIFFSWGGAGARFPMLAPGSYAGWIQLSASDEISIMIERSTHSEDLLFVAFEPGWEPQVTSASVRAGGDVGAWELPLTIRGAGATFQLVGERVDGANFQGKIMELGSQREGRWKLSRSKEVDFVEAQDPAQLQMRILLTQEYATLTQQSEELETTIETQKSDITQLTRLINESGLAEEQSAGQVKLLEAELSDIQQKLDSQRASSKRIMEQIDLSQRVSASGKLAALARESLEREARWAKSILKTAPEIKQEGLAESLARAQALIELKQQIDSARNTIFRLRYGDNPVPSSQNLPGTQP